MLSLILQNMTKNLKSSIAQTRAQVIKFTRYVDKWGQNGEVLREKAARNMLNIYVKKLDDLRAELKKQQQKQALIDMMRGDEELRLYDDKPKDH